MANINKISNEALEKIKKKSILVAPNNATEKGLTPNTIKKLLTDPMFSEEDSIIAEINKVVEEINDKVIFVDQYNLDKEQLNARFEEINQEIQEINNDLSALEESIKAVDDKADGINEYVESVNNTILNIQGRLTTTEIKIQQILDEIYEVGNNNSESNVAIEILNNRVTTIEDAYIKSVAYNVQKGIFTFTLQNGSIFEVDLAIEKVVANFTYNETNKSLDLILADGTVQSIPMSDFVRAFEGVENDQIQVVVQSGNRIQAILKDNSVTYEKLSDDVKEKIAAGGSGGGTTGGGNVNFVQEEKVINTWNELPDSTPYTHQANVVLDNSIAISKSIELLNNDPVLFAKYGFAIGNIVGNSVNIYSVGLPTEAVTLIFELRYGGTINELLLQTLEGVC